MTLATSDNNIALLSHFKSNKQTYDAYLEYFEQTAPNRARLETFIGKIYKKFYNTDIDEFYPSLLSIESDGTIKAVAGVRSAAQERLFSEYYIENQLVSELGRLYGFENTQVITRADIVEVGNLAPANVGQMRWLITSITGFLYSAGFKYIVFTAIPGVYNAFKRMDVPLKVITEAKCEHLPEAVQQKWGPEYYERKPMVMSGDIIEGFDIMKKNIYDTNKKLIPLFEKSCELGCQLRTQGALLDKEGDAA